MCIIYIYIYLYVCVYIYIYIYIVQLVPVVFKVPLAEGRHAAEHFQGVDDHENDVHRDLHEEFTRLAETRLA